MTPAVTESLVVPVHDAGVMLAGTLARVRAWLDVKPGEREALVVDDGSTDGTSAALAREAYPGLRVLAESPNRGKGHAVRVGLLAAVGLRRVFVDVGAAYPLEDVERVFAALERGAAVVIGSRGHPESRYVVSPGGLVGLAIRHVMGRGFNLCARWIATPGVRDTQAGLKGFSAAAATRLFSLSVIPGFAFDVEILYLARRLGLPIVEVPVRFAYEREPSTLRFFRDAFGMLRETLAVRRRAKQGGYGPLPPVA